MHFIYNSGFPDTYILKNKTHYYQDFDEFWNSYKHAFTMHSKHAATQFIATDLFNRQPNLKIAFKSLFDNCKIARYQKYDMPKAIATESFEALEKIKEFCSQN